MTSSDLGPLFASLAPSLRRFLLRFGPAISVEDVTQDTFARFVGEPQGSIQSPRAWLFRTARNLAINELKRKIGPGDTVVDVDSLDIESDAPSPEDFAISKDQAERLRGILALLPTRQREALVLFKLEELSHRQIAEKLGVSHRTVERYVADAIAHCYEYLSAFERED